MFLCVKGEKNSKKKVCVWIIRICISVLSAEGKTPTLQMRFRVLGEQVLYLFSKVLNLYLLQVPAENIAVVVVLMEASFT